MRRALTSLLPVMAQTAGERGLRGELPWAVAGRGLVPATPQARALAACAGAMRRI